MMEWLSIMFLAIMTILLFLMYQNQREIKSNQVKINEKQREINMIVETNHQSSMLAYHTLKSSLPDLVSFPVLTPSMASSEKDTALVDYLFALNMTLPEVDVKIFQTRINTNVNFTWTWGSFDESSSYQPLCNALTASGRYQSVLVVAHGQYLENGFLFNQKIFSARRITLTGEKNHTIYRGQIIGKTDVVIANCPVRQNQIILRNMVLCD
jgi:hypothetical protein